MLVFAVSLQEINNPKFPANWKIRSMYKNQSSCLYLWNDTADETETVKAFYKNFVYSVVLLVLFLNHTDIILLSHEKLFYVHYCWRIVSINSAFKFTGKNLFCIYLGYWLSLPVQAVFHDILLSFTRSRHRLTTSL